ncbi:recombinase family protein [Tranquillimonas alkanivorans]|uniref:Resolvase, N terminal domain n=1 Tax=Tranquillimonas alkanivorans TaxID=441119 RepID=A0A1I5W207_9RHOB|nr:recombinase family protein [Tranquillimonas alkanivorans]SFQ13720.1 Resolvase, N terminal domain [Tranquillimonas alkanivorans]
MAKIGYARVSTADHNLDLQIHALLEAGCQQDATFSDTISGATTERPGRDRLLATVQPGDTVIVWRLDRLGRSATDVMRIIEHFLEKEITLFSIKEGLDSSTRMGKAMIHIASVFAELERETIRERVMSGFEGARRRGTHFGRKRNLNADQREAIVQ